MTDFGFKLLILFAIIFSLCYFYKKSEIPCMCQREFHDLIGGYKIKGGVMILQKNSKEPRNHPQILEGSFWKILFYCILDFLKYILL